MAYSSNGKVYTSHPLMDEIVHNCKIILKSIVIKNDDLALQYETEESLNNFEIMKLIANDAVTFANFPFTQEYYEAYGFSSSQVKVYLEDKYAIDPSIRDDFLAFSLNYFTENFEETNDYYRTLTGLPPYNTGEDYYIPYESTNGKIGYSTVIPSIYLETHTIGYDEQGNPIYDFDTSLPLHLQQRSLVNAIQNACGIDTLLKSYKGSKYSYIQFLEDRSIDLYTARIAAKWDILYIPEGETLIIDRFKELYYVNRDMFLSRHYQEAYKYESEYYDQIMIIICLAQTFSDLVTDTPEWYIRRDIFSLRSVQYFLESYGVEYFPDIPLKYQIKIVKNLNKLIKYKSSFKDIKIILDLFNLKGTEVYKYYLYKRRTTSGSGYTPESDDPGDSYNLNFISTKLGDTYDNYIKDNIHIMQYDDITTADKYWDGEDTHENVKAQHLSRDFTIEPTKYLSIEYEVKLEEYIEQMQFLLGTIIDTRIDSDDFKIIIPSISDSTAISITDIFLMMIALSTSYEDVNPLFVFPNMDNDPWSLPYTTHYDRFYHKIDGGYQDTTEFAEDYQYNINTDRYNDTGVAWQRDANAGNVWLSRVRSDEDFLDWKTRYYGKDYLKDNYISPGMYEKFNGMVYGFNDVDLDKLATIVSQRHSKYGFEKGFTLEDLGVDKYINPSSVTIENKDDLFKFYKNNIGIYHELKERISNYFYKEDDHVVTSSYDDYKLLLFVFETLFIKKFDMNLYTDSQGNTITNFADLLKARDFTVYNLYYQIQSMSSSTARKEATRNVLNDTISVLEYYLDDPSAEYLFTFSSTASFNALLGYMYELVCFFKSYKVYFIDPYVTYRASDYIENSAKAHDNVFEMEEEYLQYDKEYTYDTIHMHEENIFVDEYIYDMSEIADISAHFDPDPYDDYDYDGGVPNTTDYDKEADGAYPSDESQYPYVMLNGGNPQLGALSIWDLNGADPKDYDVEFLDINGGKPLDVEEWNHSWFGTQGFNYIIDGGYPIFNTSIKSGIKLRVEDHQIYADIKVSSADYNFLVQNEDGLYVEDIWANSVDFDDIVTDFNETSDFYMHTFQTFAEELVIIGDEDLLNQRIIDQRDKYLHNILNTSEYLEGDQLEKDTLGYTDELVGAMVEDFGSWNQLGEWNDVDEGE